MRLHSVYSHPKDETGGASDDRKQTKNDEKEMKRKPKSVIEETEETELPPEKEEM